MLKLIQQNPQSKDTITLGLAEPKHLLLPNIVNEANRASYSDNSATFKHNFSNIPIQAKLAVNTPGDK